MKRISYENPYGDDKVYDACGLLGIMDVSGACFSGHDIARGITNMEERGNGLGAGFAVYGCYPDHADCYAFHVMYTRRESRPQTETFLYDHFSLLHAEEVPHRPTPGLLDPPLIWRYFLHVNERDSLLQSEVDYLVDKVMKINGAGLGAYVYSSGKNLGIFKGVGHPSQIAEYFDIEGYSGYLWTAHTRFPTNTPGWWGGAHPFGLLDWSVVHNGEISSYGTNLRYLEMQGYKCTMQTDTEVIAYAADFLMRRHQLPVELAARVMAPPLWADIRRLPPAQQSTYRTLRQVYSPLLINGPFTVIIAHHGEMIGLTDRIRLRPLTTAVAGKRLYLSSEEAPIRLISPQLERVWTPVGGEPIVGRLGLALPSEKEAAPPAVHLEMALPAYSQASTKRPAVQAWSSESGGRGLEIGD
ncbi:MAG: glutamine amidotransferase family protein [Thermoflexales bacterium]|nr:glutamine amidotransferase family protein [Thermoflexales bacterium]